MSKHVISILLVVAMLCAIPYAGAEQTMTELDQEFDQLIDNYKSQQQIIDTMEGIKKVLANGYASFPNLPPEDMRLEEVQIGLPEFFEYDMTQMAANMGTPYLVTGRVVDSQGMIFDVVSDTGNIIRILAYCYYDPATKSMKPGSSLPAIGDFGNFFITFYTYDFDAKMANFLLNISQEEYELATK